jgi:hypothetical protein
MRKLFTLAAAAAASGYSEQHLRKLCRDRKVAHTLRGSRYMFTAEELEGLARHIAVAVQVEEIEKRELKRAQKEVDALGLPKKGAHEPKAKTVTNEEETGE